MSDRNHITVAQTQKPQGREYLVDCKHCCVSCYPSRSRRAWCFPSLHLAQQVKEMLAEHCERSSRYRGPYHLHKDGKNLFGEGQRKPRHLKVSVCLTLSSMELCPVGPSQLCLCWSQWLKKKKSWALGKPRIFRSVAFIKVWVPFITGQASAPQAERAAGTGGDQRCKNHLAELQGETSVILPENNPAKGKGGGEGGEMPSSIQTGVHLCAWICLFFLQL